MCESKLFQSLVIKIEILIIIVITSIITIIMTIITITTIKIWKAQLHVSMIETKIGIPASSP